MFFNQWAIGSWYIERESAAPIYVQTHIGDVISSAKTYFEG
jgi:hypothetical protein